MDEKTKVLVIDDDSDFRQLYRLWLPSEFGIVEAGTGSEGIDLIDESVDAVLLDREMPGMSGEAVAAELRDGPLDPAVVMISGVDPDFDILEIPVDSYLTKPATRDRVRSTLSKVRSWREYETDRRELYALAARKATLAEYKSSFELGQSEAYRRVVERLDASHDVSIEPLTD